MLKLLLVDDQRKDLDGVSRMLNWESLGLRLIGTAVNGEDGLRKADSLSPDVIVTDVIMPFMDGLAMMEAVRRTHPRTRFIFMSCHDEFSHARKALSMGATGYVLKPVVASELQQTVARAVDEITAEKQKELDEAHLEARLRENLPLLREGYLRSLLYGTDADEETLRENGRFLGIEAPQDARLCVLFLEIDETAQEDVAGAVKAKERHLQLVGIRTLVEEHLHELPSAHPMTVDEARLALLAIDASGDPEPLLRKRLLDFATVLSADVRRLHDASLTVGLSRIARGLVDLEGAYREARDAVRLKFQLGKGQVILAEDRRLPEVRTGYDPNRMLLEIRQALLSSDPADADAFVDRLTGTSGEAPSEAYTRFVCTSSLSFAQLVLLEFKGSLEEALGDEAGLYERTFCLETAQDIAACLKDSLRAIQRHIGQRTGVRNQRIIEKIEEIVREKHATELTIADVAHEIYLSPSYTGYLYKQETGRSFTEYLTRVRIERAKDLLRETRLKIFEVAEQVGFTNKSYFCSLFKEKTGVTPKEYRESLW